MQRLVNIAIHPSQFPDRIRRDLLASLRTRRVNHKFHYDSVKQTQKWLALHQAYSPARTDKDCARTYDLGFEAAIRKINTSRLFLVGLGCGGGQKDSRLLELLLDGGCEAVYTPADVSVAMVLTARQSALKVLAEENCLPMVCDLATADDLPAAIDELAASHPGFRSKTRNRAPRLFTFFGMLPNFEPGMILGRLASVMRRGDYLLFSANLAPGPDYAAGVRRILPLYDNELTRDWLLAFLLDLGAEKRDGRLQFVIEDRGGLKRVAAHFRFDSTRNIAVAERSFQFRSGDSMRLFFSYRHTPALIRSMLNKHRIEVMEDWITRSEEEGVFLCRKN